VQYIQNGGNYSSDSPGAPIAYKLAYLDNSVAEMAFTTDYAERTCTKNRADLHVDLKSIKHVSGGDVGDNIEFYGYVGIQYPTPGNPVTSCGVGGEYADLWYLPDGSWITVPEFGTWTPPGGLSVDLYDVPMGPNQNVCIYIDVWDEDYSTSELSGDDDYGVGVKLLGWQAGWQGTQSVTSSGAGSNSAMATFGISVK
jgi:hypothetical protein